MHTAVTRGGVVFFFSLSTLFVCGLICALSYYTTTTPASNRLNDINISNIRVNYPKPFRGAAKGMEYALVEFNLHADLSSLWNWNVKQLLVSVVAHFVTPTHSQNAQIVWTRIISSEAGAHAFNLTHEVFWEMQQPMSESRARGSEVALLSAQRGDLIGMSKNVGAAENRSIELRLQYELFPLVGSTFLGEVPNKSARFTIQPHQPIYVVPQ